VSNHRYIHVTISNTYCNCMYYFLNCVPDRIKVLGFLTAQIDPTVYIG